MASLSHDPYGVRLQKQSRSPSLSALALSMVWRGSGADRTTGPRFDGGGRSAPGGGRGPAGGAASTPRNATSRSSMRPPFPKRTGAGEPVPVGLEPRAGRSTPRGPGQPDPAAGQQTGTPEPPI